MQLALRRDRGLRGLRSRSERREERVAYGFLSPWIIGLLLFWIGPIVASFVLSFTDWNLLNPPRWTGTQNYAELHDDYHFTQSVNVTLKYTVMAVPIYIVAGFALALLLNLKVRGMNLFRTIMFIPSVLSGVAVAVLWMSLLNPDVGAVNGIVESLGWTHPPRWLSSPTWAVPSLVLIGLWGVGGNAIIYLSGLQNIPEQLYEAIALDGAGPWQRFRFVTLPMLSPTLLFVLLTSVIGAFQVFDTAYVLGGRQGNGDAMRFFLINVWQEGFLNGRLGYASALAWIFVVVAAIVILLIFRTSGSWVYYEYEPERL